MTRPGIVLTERDEKRFRAKVSLPNENGCQLWLASLDANGYGQFRLGSRTPAAHRVAFALAGEPWPTAMELDHACNIRHCVAVDHLEPVTHEENNRRIGIRAEFCRAGLHRWDAQVPIVRSPRHRECRPCRNARLVRQYAGRNTK